MIQYDWLIESMVLAYLLGSVPFGLLITRAAGIKNLREIGSGNIGATNVMRTGRKSLGVLTLLLDATKGFLAVWVISRYFTDFYALFAGFFVVIGHCFTVWLRFRGGKGVATTIGVFFALNPLLGLSVCALWLGAFYCTRISSVAAMISIGYSAVAAYFISEDWSPLLCLALAMLIIFTHRGNIQRLLEGNELNFGGKS